MSKLKLSAKDEHQPDLRLVRVGSIAQPHVDVMECYYPKDDRLTVLVAKEAKSWRLRSRPRAIPIVNELADGSLRCIHHWEIVKAATGIGISAMTVEVICIAPEDELGDAILNRDRTDEQNRFQTMGAEVHGLIDYAKRHWAELKAENPNLKRVKDWVAHQLGYKSDDTVNKLLKIMDYDPFLLQQTDTGELGTPPSIEPAYRKAIGEEPHPKQKDLNKGNILEKTCNCPRYLDEDGNVCPLIKEWTDKKKKGGVNVAA